MSGSRGRTDASSGFTVIEVLVGLLVLSLAALLALPMTRAAVSTQGLRGAGSDIAALARMTRAAATKAGAERTLAFEGSTGRFWADGIAPPRTLPNGISGQLQVVGAAPGGAQRIRFLAGGASSGGRLVLSDGARTVVVTVDWLTGGVDVAW